MQNLIFSLAVISLLGCAIHTGGKSAAHNIEGISTDFEVQRVISYSKRDDSQLLGDMYVPTGQGPYPAVLLIHGGSWAGGDRSYMDGIARRLARNGFAVFNISYSFAPKYHFPAQIEDCKEAVRFMRRSASAFKIDAQEIGVWGYSAGAHLAALLGTMTQNTEDAVKAVVAGSGPYNLTLYPNDSSTIQFLGSTINENPEIFREASPVYQVDRSTPPMFLYHGTWDKTVDPAHTLEMKRLLDQAGISSEMYLVRGLGHISLFVFGWAADNNAIKFLKSHLYESRH